MLTLTDIENRARRFAEFRQTLGAHVAALNAALETAKRAHLGAIKRAAERAAIAEAELRDALEDGKALFEKPRTRVMHGIKLGWVKGKGKLVVADEERTITLIRRHMGDRLEELVKTIERPLKEALENLSAAELKKIGVEVVDGIDAPLIKLADGEIDKLVEALLDGYRDHLDATRPDESEAAPALVGGRL